MASLRARKVLRDLWLHKARTILVVLAIGIGIVGAGSTLDTWALLRTVTKEGYAATNPASATIRVDSVDAGLLALVRAVPGVADAEARRTVLGRALVKGVWRTAVLFTAGDLGRIRIGTVAPKDGIWPPADGTLAIETSSVDYAGAVVGEPMLFQVGDSAEVAVTVSGTVRDEGLAPGWMEHVVYGFAPGATLRRLGAPASFNQLLITVRDRKLDWDGVRRVAAAVKESVTRSGHRVTDVEVPEPGRHIHAGQIDSLLFTKGAFGFLALLLSGFLVINLISAMLTGQVREIGVMKAIGARSGQVAGMYLGLAGVLGLLACVVALPVAALIGRGYARFIAEVLNFDSSGFRIPTWALAVQVAVGGCFPVLAAAIPVWRGCRIRVGEALRDVGIDGGGRTGTILSRVSGPARPLLLSLRNAFRRRQRMALTLATLALGGAVYLGALNLRTSIQDSVTNMYGRMLRQDLTLQFADSHAPDTLESALRGMPGVAAAEAWTGARAALQRADGSLGNGLAVTGVPTASGLLALPIEEGRWLGDSTANELVASRRALVEEPSLHLGGSVTLVIGGRPTRWTLVGISGGGAFVSIYAPRQAVARALGDPLMRTVLVRAADRTAPGQAALSRRLRGELGDRGLAVASSQLMAEQRAVMQDHLLLVAQSLLVMAQLMILVGGLGLASTMSLAVLERTRELGVLRALGARNGAIHTIVQVEGLVIALASWLLAIPLSVPMSVVVGRAFGRIMMPVPDRYVPGAGGVLTWLLVVLAVSVVACAWPALRATRIPTAAALAYE